MHLYNGSIDFNCNFLTMNNRIVILIMALSSSAMTNRGQSLETKKLEFLIGKIQAFHQGNLVYKDSSYQHIQSLPFNLHQGIDCITDSIQFQLGVDSLQHEQGIIHNGLTPTNGMYWAWQSGYIFVKWEGVIKNGNGNGNGIENGIEFSPFTFHLGGFQYPFRCDQQCAFRLEKPKKISEIALYFEPTKEIFQFIQKSDLEIMSPQPAAVQMMQLFKSCLHAQ